MTTLLGEIARLSSRESGRIAAARGEGVAVDSSPDKLAALEEVVAVLDPQHLPYALVGGVAVGLRSGVPRATIDTDLAVATTVDRSRVIRLLTALVASSCAASLPTRSISAIAAASSSRSGSTSASIR